MLTQEHENYLEARGYTPQMIQNEKPVSAPPGRFNIHGVEISLPHPGIVFKLYSSANTFFGLHVATPGHDPKYFNFINPELPWIPAIYGTERDFDLVYQTHELVVVEGLFDRAVFTQLFPEKACIARLSKGMTKKFQNYIMRFVDTLYVAYDMDDPGKQGWFSTKKRLHPQVWCTKIDYPAHDPSDLLQKFGFESAKSLLERKL